MELSTLERKKVICTHCNAGHARTYLISDGIELSYFTLTSETTKFCHAPLPHVIEINYCRAGRLATMLLFISVPVISVSTQWKPAPIHRLHFQPALMRA